MNEQQTEVNIQRGVPEDHPDKDEEFNPDLPEEKVDGDYMGQTDDLDDLELPSPETEPYNVEWEPEEQP